jgi:hypothetical protein
VAHNLQEVHSKLYIFLQNVFVYKTVSDTNAMKLFMLREVSFVCLLCVFLALQPIVVVFSQPGSGL